MVARAHFRSFLGMSGARGTLQPSPLNNVFGRGPRSAVGPRISYVAAWVAPWERNGPTPPLTAARQQPTARRLLMARANGC